VRNDAVSIISRKLGISKEQFHQNYEAVGRSMIIREEDEFSDDEGSFSRLMLSSFKLWAVYRYTGIRGNRRLPLIKLVSGIHTEVVQREDGILYMMDPQKVMFSKGNKKERHILTEEADKEETVLDMFAGIGYFSIPLSFKVRRVYACEINPDSFHYLIMNKKLNGAKALVPMFGDSSRLEMRDFADRIIMGHFESDRYLQRAMTYLKKRGKIHLHKLSKRGESGDIVEEYESSPFVSSVKIRKVKSYSPSHDHIVLDLDVIKS
jgi:tRNA wybutosine-synthesizing protein 2